MEEKNISIYFPKGERELIDQLETLATRKGLSRSKLVRKILHRHVNFKVVRGEDEALRESTRLVKKADNRCFGLGRDFTIIEDTVFREGIKEAIRDGVDIKALGANEGNIDRNKSLLEGIGVKVKLWKDIGLRMIITEGEGLVYFRPPFCSSFSGDYVGVQIQEDALVRRIMEGFVKTWNEIG